MKNSNDKSRLSFSFGWLALKLMGKSLYSNAWSAISELVANGFDANAKKVYVLVDAVNKKDATIEIFDDGDGMTRDEMEIYTQVGFNKRNEYMRKNKTSSAPATIMGRKGIGKLAALYLSSHYYVITKPKVGNPSCWELVFKENPEDNNEKPSLEFLNVGPSLCMADKWDKARKGTIIKLTNVDLSGAGEKAFEVLSPKLANYFALDAMRDKDILLCIRRVATQKIEFKSVEKKIAFGNMAFILYSPEGSERERKMLTGYQNREQEIPYQKIDGKHKNYISVSAWQKNDKAQNPYVAVGIEGKQVSVPYKLTGWIGIHGTIDKEGGKDNDVNFLKTPYYTPNQIRLYVRNKLAVENFLNILNSTATYANYIEGEIHFDLLDDDALADIATSNRQSVDEHDARVELLQELLRPIMRELINKRTALAAEMRDEERKILDERQNAAKSQFITEVSDELDQISDIKQEDRSRLTTIIANKVAGDVTLKNEYVIFLSHSSNDKALGDFFYQLLLEVGVEESEIFYTSRDDDVKKNVDKTPLSDQIKNCIVKKNTLLFYLIGHKYKESEFCMFEGGAGWATRAIGDYPVVAVKHGHIPAFLTNGKNEIHLFNNAADTIPLDRNNYADIVYVLNRLIKHINKGRELRKEKSVPYFNTKPIPKKTVLVRRGKTERDYMDGRIKEHWKVYVEETLPQYIAKMKSDEEGKKSKK